MLFTGQVRTTTSQASACDSVATSFGPSCRKLFMSEGFCDKPRRWHRHFLLNHVAFQKHASKRARGQCKFLDPNQAFLWCARRCKLLLGLMDNGGLVMWWRFLSDEKHSTNTSYLSRGFEHGRLKKNDGFRRFGGSTFHVCAWVCFGFLPTDKFTSIIAQETLETRS